MIKIDNFITEAGVFDKVYFNGTIDDFLEALERKNCLSIFYKSSGQNSLIQNIVSTKAYISGDIYMSAKDLDLEDEKAAKEMLLDEIIELVEELQDLEEKTEKKEEQKDNNILLFPTFKCDPINSDDELKIDINDFFKKQK